MKTSFIFRVLLAGLFLGLLAVGCQKDGPVLFEEELAEATTLRGPVSFPNIIPLPDGFQPEGIAIGRGTDFYVGSLISGAIYKGDLRTGEGDILVPEQSGRRAVGLSFDQRSKLLFAAGGFTGDAVVYDSESGEMAAMIAFVNPMTTPTMVNDVVVTRKAAYFTDCFQPFLYKVPLGPAGRLPNPLTFEAIPLSGDFFMTDIAPPYFGVAYNANGIDATPNGKYLVIVNLSTGYLYRVDAETGDARLIDLGGESVLFGDGILLDGLKLYVVRNLLNMITAIDLSPDLLSGQVTGVITAPEFQIPSTIAEFGSFIYAVNARYDVAPPTGPHPDVAFSVVRADKQ